MSGASAVGRTGASGTLKEAHPSFVIRNRVRFTILAANLIRAEYAGGGAFLDGPTITVAERRGASTPFEVTEADGAITIRTSEITLWHRMGDSGFTAENLRIDFHGPAGSGSWIYGQEDPGILPGTLRTVDLMDGPKRYTRLDRDAEGRRVPAGERIEPFLPGYISRSGYTVFDDSGSIPLSAHNAAGEPWVAHRREGLHQDLYFAAYGKDFHRGLRTIARILGKQPVPPRYALGLWFSRFWEFTDRDIEQIVRDHNRRKVPLDVLVMDMDWHQPGWTGYSWNGSFFPNPDHTLALLRDEGIRITMNLHPATGVGPHEDRYAEFCAAMGIDPAERATIPFDCTDPRFMEAYFRLLHHPLEDMGVEFWWIDWQQGEQSAIEGLDPLPWLNLLHWRDLATRFPRRRPMIFSRFGGPGAGRYPVGFSGDAFITWDSLAFQPYLTATSANVGFGYWSHDIGGHWFGDSTDAELFTRWVQFGVLSPVLRFHQAKSPEDHRFPWNFPRPHQDHLLDAVDLRYRLQPYLSSELLAAYRDDTSLCMPMYYEYPECDDAYEAGEQYFFGRTFLAAPVCRPSDEKTGLAAQRIWIPDGDWIDLALGVGHRGPAWITQHYTLAEIPLLARRGAIWVEQSPKTRTLPGSYADLHIFLLPGANGHTVWMEDDGETTAYQQGAIAEIEIRQTTEAGTTSIRIGPGGPGTFEGFQPHRPVWLHLPFRCPPVSVCLDGSAVPYVPRGGEPAWHYQGDRLEVVVALGTIDLAEGAEVVIRTAPSRAAVPVANFVEQLTRIRNAWAFDQTGAVVEHGDFNSLADRPQNPLPWLAQTGSRLTHFPERFEEILADFAEKSSTLLEDYRAYCRHVDSTHPEKARHRQLKGRALAIVQTIDTGGPP